MKTASTVARRTLDDLQSPPTGVSAPGTGVSAPGIETPVVLPVGALGARAADTPWPASSGSSDMSPLIPRRLLALLVAFIGLLAPAVAPSAQAASEPTIVLVHGAFADASGWNGEIARLERRGYAVVAPANPLRGVSADAAYLRAFLATIKGPIVLVGHSYGGFVITNAATGNPNVKALVLRRGLLAGHGRQRPIARHARQRRTNRPCDARPAAVSGARGLAAAGGLHQARRVP
jgi:pimeloyl-ACP methyl ester carboxylesterase